MTKSSYKLQATSYKKWGFTLVELLIVVTIIAILTMIGVVGYQAANKKGRDGRRQSDLEQVRTALELYHSDNGVYPANTSSLVPDYISAIPADPKATAYKYVYYSVSPFQQYAVCAHIESTTGSDAVSPLCGVGSNLCGVSPTTGTCNYVVQNP